MRRELDPIREQEANQCLFTRLAKLPQILEAACVYAYMSYGHEAGTKELLSWLWSRGKQTAVPRVDGTQMDFFYITSMEDLEVGYGKILEPKKQCRRAADPYAPMVIPGVAFDPWGNRLGYGGGYYDRFLEREKGHFKIGIAFEFQMKETLPTEPLDQPMDVVLTPTGQYGPWKEKNDGII